MLYNISEFLTLIKTDMGIKDLPMPVDDAELLKRFETSALKEFSVRAPRVVDCVLTEADRIKDSQMDDFYARYIYKVPKRVYQDATILEVVDFDISRPSGYSDYYMPQTAVGSPLTVLESIADIQIAAAMASATSRAPTWRFVHPDKLIVFHGWTAGSYVITLTLTHDVSLTTIPPTAITHLRQLAVLDLEEYLYDKLKRKDGLDVGVGQINLKIDDWQSAGEKKADLLREWDQNGTNIDIDSISYY